MIKRAIELEYIARNFNKNFKVPFRGFVRFIEGQRMVLNPMEESCCVPLNVFCCFVSKHISDTDDLLGGSLGPSLRLIVLKIRRIN